MAARRCEVEGERFTGIDRRLLVSRKTLGLASAWHGDPAEQSLRAGRLAKLVRMGLAHEEGRGSFWLDENLEGTLRAMGRRRDIIATMHRDLRERRGLAPADHATYDPARGETITGRVVAQGLSMSMSIALT